MLEWNATEEYSDTQVADYHGFKLHVGPHDGCWRWSVHGRGTWASSYSPNEEMAKQAAVHRADKLRILR